MVNPTWTYPPEFLEALLGFGLAPTPDTRPVFVRDAVNDLYRYELRRVRDRHRAGDIAKVDYLDVVVALRRKYWLLTLPAAAWERICGNTGELSPEAQTPVPGRRKR
jgi:hypothetical protein